MHAHMHTHARGYTWHAHACTCMISDTIDANTAFVLACACCPRTPGPLLVRGVPCHACYVRVVAWLGRVRKLLPEPCHPVRVSNAWGHACVACNLSCVLAGPFVSTHVSFKCVHAFSVLMRLAMRRACHSRGLRVAWSAVVHQSCATRVDYQMCCTACMAI